MSRELPTIGLPEAINFLLKAAAVVGTNQSERNHNPEWEKYLAWPQTEQLLYPDPNPNNQPMINFLRACVLLYQNSPDPFKRVTLDVNGLTIQVKVQWLEDPPHYQMLLIDPRDGQTALISQLPEELKEWLEEIYPSGRIIKDDLLQAILRKAW